MEQTCLADHRVFEVARRPKYSLLERPANSTQRYTCKMVFTIPVEHPHLWHFVAKTPIERRQRRSSDYPMENQGLISQRTKRLISRANQAELLSKVGCHNTNRFGDTDNLSYNGFLWNGALEPNQKWTQYLIQVVPPWGIGEEKSHYANPIMVNEISEQINAVKKKKLFTAATLRFWTHKIKATMLKYFEGVPNMIIFMY